MIDDLKDLDLDNEEEQELQTWQTTFADLTTLLLVFFVLLYSMSWIDTGKYLASFASIKAALGTVTGSPIVLQDDQGGVFMNEVQKYRQIMAEQENNISSFRQFSTEHGIEGMVGANLESGIITLRAPADTLFKSNSATLTPEAIRVITLLKDYFLLHHDLKINIKGHTDNLLPAPGGRWKDNWELSSMRAVAVLKLLLKLGIKPERLTATGMGSFQPAFPNNTPENRAKNRRVEFILEKTIGGTLP
jgi:chemotaxis protein MotB